MVMHIEDGEYLIRQNGSEVGKVVVTAGAEHWFLHTTIPAGGTNGIYTAPSPLDPKSWRGPFSVGEAVETVFEYKGAAPADLKAYVDAMRVAATVPKYIIATLTCGGPVTAARSAPGNGVGPSGQIDWGIYRIMQSDKLVGVVDVRPNKTGLPLEHWMLFQGAYVPPSPINTRVGYSLVLDRRTVTATDLVPKGTTYEIIDADCNAFTLRPAP